MHGQLRDGCALVEASLRDAPGNGWLCGEAPTQADITVGVAWTFTQIVAAEIVSAREYPSFAGFAGRAEQLPAFAALQPT